MTVWINGHEVTPAKRVLIHCETCGHPSAVLCINDQGLCRWFCSEHAPALPHATLAPLS